MAIVMIDFLLVKCQLAFNRVLYRPLLKALKAVMSIHSLTIKFPTAAGIGHVRGRRGDSRECYNKALELAEMTPELSQAMEVGKTSQRPIETNIDSHLQEDESTAGPIEELIKIRVDPNEPSCIVKIDKGIKKELAQQLAEFLSLNQDVF